MKDASFSQRVIAAGQYKDQREYQSLKTANEMEREATAKLHERLKRKVGDTAAKEQLKQKGYDPSILR